MKGCFSMYERRSAERLPCNVDCQICTASFDMYFGKIKNISKAGMGIFIGTEILDNLVDSKIVVMFKSQELEVLVVRQDPVEGFNSFLGVWFEDLNDEDFSDLMFYCSV